MICRNIARLASAVATSIRTERCPRENAHRWRRLSTTFPNCYIGREVFISGCSSGRRATPKGRGEFFFCCIAELAIKPCRSSRSKLRGEFGIPKHLQNRKPKTQQSNKPPKPKTQHKTKRTRQVFGM